MAQARAARMSNAEPSDPDVLRAASHLAADPDARSCVCERSPIARSREPWVLPVADAILEEPRLAEICDSPDPDRSDLDAYAALADEFSAGTVLDVVEKGISTRTNGVTAGSLPTCRAWPSGPPRPGRNGRRGHADPARDCPPEGEHCRHQPRRAVRDPPHHARRQGSTQPSRTRAVLSPDGPRPSSVRTRIGDLAHDRRQLRAACDQGVRYGVNRRGIRDGHYSPPVPHIRLRPAGGRRTQTFVPRDVPHRGMTLRVPPEGPGPCLRPPAVPPVRLPGVPQLRKTGPGRKRHLGTRAGERPGYCRNSPAGSGSPVMAAAPAGSVIPFEVGCRRGRSRRRLVALLRARVTSQVARCSATRRIRQGGRARRRPVRLHTGRARQRRR